MDDGDSVVRSVDRAGAAPGDDGSATPLPETVRISLLSFASSRALRIGRRSGIGTPRLDAGSSWLRADWALSARVNSSGAHAGMNRRHLSG
jgi:hypothetical protein